MPPKLLTQPTMNHTSLDHVHRSPDPAIHFVNWTHVAIVQFYSTICSLIWLCALVLSCPDVSRVPFDTSDPKTPYNSLHAIPTIRKFGSHCEWDFRRPNIRHVRTMCCHVCRIDCNEMIRVYHLPISLRLFATNSPFVAIIFDRFELFENGSFVRTSHFDFLRWRYDAQAKLFVIGTAIARWTANTELITVTKSGCRQKRNSSVRLLWKMKRKIYLKSAPHMSPCD